MKTKFAITTITLIRTDEEREIVLKTLKHLNDLNFPIIITDGDSLDEDKSAIKSFSNVHFFETDKGLTDELMISHKEAVQIGEYLLYLQSDKLDFAKTTAKNMIDNYEKLDKKGVLIPTRTRESLATYPPFQQTQEAFLNFFMSDYIGIENDYFAGPKIYPSYLVKYLDQLKGDIGWGIEAFFYVIAKRLGLPFDFLPFFMKTPKDIGDPDEIKKYRLQITQWQIAAFLQGLNVKL